MRSFAEFFPFAAFTSMVERYGKGMEPDAYQDMLYEQFIPKLGEFLVERHAERPLAPIETFGHVPYHAPEWDAFIRGGALPDLFGVAHEIFSMARASGRRKDPAAAAAQAAYDQLIADVNAGNTLFDPVSAECGYCGERLVLVFEDWQPVLRRVAYGSKDRGYAVPAPCSYEHGLKEAEIRVTSGEVWVADWFRLDDFTAVVEEGKPTLSINYAAGTVALTQHYAKAHGFVSVYVGNSVPPVYLNAEKNELVIGRMCYDLGDGDWDTVERREGFESQGNVCTDLWWATIIDPEQLVALLTGKLGQAKARAAVAEYAKENPHSFIRVPLRNGGYRLLFDDTAALRERLHASMSGSGHPKDRPYLMLQPTES